jgi:hypothetical protein
MVIDAGMVEAVADGGGSGADAGDLELDDLLAEQGDDALQRADPARAFGGGGGVAPAHRLGPGKGADDGGIASARTSGRGAAGLVDDGVIDAVAFYELVLGEAGLAEEAFQRLRRARGARALGLLADGGGLGGESAGDEGEAAGGGVGLDAAGCEARLASSLETGGEVRRALPCIRAGISSERSSRRKSGIQFLPAFAGEGDHAKHGGGVLRR